MLRQSKASNRSLPAHINTHKTYYNNHRREIVVMDNNTLLPSSFSANRERETTASETRAELQREQLSRRPSYKTEFTQHTTYSKSLTLGVTIRSIYFLVNNISYLFLVLLQHFVTRGKRGGIFNIFSVSVREKSQI
eukprot:sb/3474618/